MCADFLLPKLCLRFADIHREQLLLDAQFRAKFLLHVLHLVQSGAMAQSDADLIVPSLR